MTTATHWRDRYTDVAARVLRDAPASGPFVLGFNVCVDAVWHVDAALLERLGTLVSPAKSGSAAASRLCRRILDRVTRGRGGEIFCDWTDGPAWFAEHIPPPRRLQVGGTGPQAAWTLAVLGTRCLLPLADRSRAQLQVLHPDIEVAIGAEWTPLRRLLADAGPPTPGRPFHHIFEFTAGTQADDLSVARSTRVIVRFADDGIECDENFAAAQRTVLPSTQGGVISGMNAIGPSDTASWHWLDATVQAWADLGVPHVHLELAEYPSRPDLEAAAAYGAGRAHSLGMSLSELRTLTGGPHPSWSAVGDLATRHGYDLVVVHADDWALAVHRDDSTTVEARLLSGGLLASARAAWGTPTAHLQLPEDAAFVDDRPASQALGDGWRLTCVPTPWQRAPATTIGLGDSFVAGFQLGAALVLSTDPAPKSQLASPPTV